MMYSWETAFQFEIILLIKRILHWSDHVELVLYLLLPPNSKMSTSAFRFGRLRVLLKLGTYTSSVAGLLKIFTTKAVMGNVSLTTKCTTCSSRHLIFLASKYTNGIPKIKDTPT